MKRCSIFTLIALAAGCGGDGADEPQRTTQSTAKPGIRDGYRRFEAKPTPVAAGQTVMGVQWVGPATDRDLDVVDIVGWQSASGHHALLYATANVQPVGTARDWQNQDQLASRLIGGSGGEAGGQVKLPPGVVTRIPKGHALILQLHYMNTSSKDLMGESVVDVKMVDASPAHRVASFFSSTNVAYELPPQQGTSHDVTCKLKEDVPLIMFANHQHHMGVSVFTEQILPDGTRTEVKRDERWQYEWAFNPNYTYRPVDSPFILKAGNTLHTHCEWLNTGPTAVRFPDEMCVFFGFFLGERDISCAEGGPNP
jgi:hypothetical protein